MQKIKNKKGLLEREKFAFLEREKKEWLSNLSMKKAISLEEKLLSSYFAWEWRKNFSPDNPICLKDILKKKI